MLRPFIVKVPVLGYFLYPPYTPSDHHSEHVLFFIILIVVLLFYNNKL